MSFEPRNSPVAVVTMIATIAGLALAYQMGQWTANSNYKFVAAVFGAGGGMLIVFTLQRHFWLLIPLCWVLSGRMSWLPLPFSVQEMGVFAAFGVFVVRTAMKSVSPVTPKFNHLDMLLWFNVAIIVAMWIRTPVGLAFLGSEIVGGKPYMNVAVGLMAYLVLHKCFAGPKLAYVFPLLLLGPTAMVSFLGVFTYVFPATAPLIYPLYSGIDISSYMQDTYQGGAGGSTIQEGRFQTLGNLGMMMIMALLAYVGPARAMNPLGLRNFLILFFALIFIGLSGFRSALIQGTATILLASYFWHGGIGVFRTAFLGFVALVLAYSYQGVADLPRSIQRSLSFIPGPWNEEIVRGAKSSTDWRVDMWKTALTSDRYIKNKWIGNGFGFSKEDLAIMVSGSMGGQGYFGDENNKEAFMIQGSYHSGPVTAIHFAGVLGLIGILALQIAIAGYSYRLLRRAWNTPMRPLAIVLALEAVYRPIHFIFIFGEYRGDLPSAFYQAGMMKMLENSLNAYTPVPPTPARPAVPSHAPHPRQLASA